MTLNHFPQPSSKEVLSPNPCLDLTLSFLALQRAAKRFCKNSHKMTAIRQNDPDPESNLKDILKANVTSLLEMAAFADAVNYVRRCYHELPDYFTDALDLWNQEMATFALQSVHPHVVAYNLTKGPCGVFLVTGNTPKLNRAFRCRLWTKDTEVLDSKGVLIGTVIGHVDDKRVPIEVSKREPFLVAIKTISPKNQLRFCDPNNLFLTHGLA